MIEAPRHQIDAGGCCIRVLRLVALNGHTYPLRYRVRLGSGCCRMCFCTDSYACPDGCGWVNRSHTLCNRCYAKLLA